MNPPNPSSGTPATNKLILLVLTGIFICLVLLVIRAFDRQPAVAPNVAVSVTSTPEAEPAPEVVSVIESRPARRPLTNPARTTVISATPQPVVSAPAEEAPVSVSHTIVLPPASIGRAGSSRSGEADSINVVGGGIIAGNPSVVGTITLQGQPSPEIPIDLGPSCGRFTPPATTRHYVVGQEGGLANVMVLIASSTTNAKQIVVEAPVIGPGPLLDQVGCMFEPYVMVVGVNQKFGIRNSDPEMHNVHAIPYHNKEFNFAQLPGAPITLKSFNEGGDLVRIKCDVHPWMFAYIGVVRNPWFAVSDTNGFYQIPHNLPAGRYQITARHLKAGIQTQEIIVEKGQPAIANFRFTVPGTATPQTTEVARESR